MLVKRIVLITYILLFAPPFFLVAPLYGWQNLPDNAAGRVCEYIKGGRSSAVMIAASTASSEEKKAADYVCDGTADDVQILAAINGLPSNGGLIIFGAGIFNIAAPITFDSWLLRFLGQEV